MAWDIEVTAEFKDWWNDLSVGEQESVTGVVGSLEERGPTLPSPISTGIKTSKHGHMRELRIQHGGRPYRILYAFDPNRTAILLLGGEKGGDDRWYVVNVPKADKLYDDHLRNL
jgi:hypothetical protein